MFSQSLVFVLLALGFHQGEAIKCYQCSSASNEKCGDPMDSSLVAVECVPNSFQNINSMFRSAADSVSNMLGNMGIDFSSDVPDASSTFTCVKAVKEENDKKMVIRSCSIPKLERFDMCQQLKNKGGITFCESCEKDDCNGASSAVPPSLLFLVAGALAAYLLTAKQ